MKTLEPLDAEQARRIDAVCRKFEADWRAGNTPTIEPALEEIEPSGRGSLLFELVALDREIRIERGDQPMAPDYLARFPGFDQAIEAAFRDPTQNPTTITRELTPDHELPTIPPIARSDQPVTEAFTIPPGRPLVWVVANETIASDQDDNERTILDHNTAEPVKPAKPKAGSVRYFGDYQLERELARGGMGVVYRARQVNLNRTVALKMILAGQLASEDDVKRFYLEAEAAANLDHPGIVPIYEVGQFEGQHYFSMGFVEGQSLANQLAGGPLPPRAAVSLTREVAEAVHYAHEHGVIHRDLKPANVLLDAKGRAKVTDFGLAKKLEGDSGLTATGQVMGTPSYMPPEQAEGRSDVGPLADVYSLGAILYCLLTGRPPFQASGVMDTLLQVMERDPVPPRQLNAEVPRDLETICLKCLEKEQGRRYASAQALVDDLSRWLDGRPIEARRTTRLERGLKWARRRPAAAALVVVSLLAAVTVVAMVANDIRLDRKRIVEVTKERNAANHSEEKARVEARKALRQVLRLAIHNGDRLMLEDNALLALPWYVYALIKEPDGPDAERRHRIRLASILAHSPRLLGLEFGSIEEARRASSGGKALPRTIKPPANQKFTQTTWSPDGSRVLTTSRPYLDSVKHADSARKGMATVWDARSGQPVFPPLTLPYKVTHGEFLDGGKRFVTVMEIETLPKGAPRVLYATEVRVWETETGKPVGDSVKLPDRNVTLEQNPSGDRLIIHGPGRSQVRDSEGFRLILPREGEGEGQEPMTVARFSLDGQAIAASTAHAARIYRASDSEAIGEPLNHGSSIEDLAFNSNATELVTSGGGLVRVWQVKTGLLVASGEVGGQVFAGISPDGQHLLTRSARDIPRAWRIDRAQKAIVVGSPPLPAAGWSPTIRAEAGANFVVPSRMRSGFDLLTGELVVTSTNSVSNEVETRRWAGFPGSSLKVMSNRNAFEEYGIPKVVVPPNRPYYVSLDQVRPTAMAGFHRTISAGSPSADPARNAGWSRPEKPASVLAVLSGDSTRMLIVSASESKTFLKTLARYARPSVGFSGLDFQVVALPSEAPAGPWIHREGWVGSVALSPDGRRLALSVVGTKHKEAKPALPRSIPDGIYDEVRVYNLETGQLDPSTFQISGHKHEGYQVEQLAFSPDGRSILVRESQQNTSDALFLHPNFYLLDAESLKPVAPPFSIPQASSRRFVRVNETGLLHPSQWLDFSPDGRRIALADGGSSFGVFDPRTGRVMGRVPSTSGQILWVEFSPDGKRVASAGTDGTVHLWDSGTGEPVGPAMLHGGVIMARFNLDGSILASCAPNTRQPLMAWDGMTGEPILEGPKVPAGEVAFGDDPRRVLIGTELGGMLPAWDLPIIERPKEELEALATVMSGHVIDSGENLSPASSEQLQTAWALLKGGTAGAPSGSRQGSTP